METCLQQERCTWTFHVIICSFLKNFLGFENVWLAKQKTIKAMHADFPLLLWILSKVTATVLIRTAWCHNMIQNETVGVEACQSWSCEVYFMFLEIMAHARTYTHAVHTVHTFCSDFTQKLLGSPGMPEVCLLLIGWAETFIIISRCWWVDILHQSRHALLMRKLRTFYLLYCHLIKKIFCSFSLPLHCRGMNCWRSRF